MGTMFSFSHDSFALTGHIRMKVSLEIDTAIGAISKGTRNGFGATGSVVGKVAGS